MDESLYWCRVDVSVYRMMGFGWHRYVHTKNRGAAAIEVINGLTEPERMCLNEVQVNLCEAPTEAQLKLQG